MARTSKPPTSVTANNDGAPTKDKQKLMKILGKEDKGKSQTNGCNERPDALEAQVPAKFRPVLDFNERLAEQQGAGYETPRESSRVEDEEEIAVSQPSPIKSSPGVVRAAFDRMRPRRDPVEVATITIGSKTTISPLRPISTMKMRTKEASYASPKARSGAKSFSTQRISRRIKAFTAPGAQAEASPGASPDELDLDEQIDSESASESEEAENVEQSDSSDEQSEQEEAKRAVLETLEAESDESGSDPASDTGCEDNDGDYLDEESKKAGEDARVIELIQLAEDKSAPASQHRIKRASQLLKGGGQKDATTSLIQVIQTSLERIESQMQLLQKAIQDASMEQRRQEQTAPLADDSPEAVLSLTVSKDDFSRMRIIGQFNLGFILAVRPSSKAQCFEPNASSDQPTKTNINSGDELFIIDQHASDEKINFERLQRVTTLQNQRLVYPKPLSLTAIEEEIILENQPTLAHNGFIVAVDTSGDKPVGSRCSLLSLPMSKEVTFDLSDLEELITLLAESPPILSTSTSTANTLGQYIPRPSKTRRLFAMRACRSSIMIGRPLSRLQTERLVRRMGEIEKPWNCPHGRPTMRHVLSLANWESWTEGDGGRQSGQRER